MKIHKQEHDQNMIMDGFARLRVKPFWGSRSTVPCYNPHKLHYNTCNYPVTIL